MRNAGERTPGGSSGRRQRGASAEQPPAGGTGGASLFTPAYRVNHAAAGTRPVTRDGSDQSPSADPDAGYRGNPSDLPGSGYPWADSESGQPRASYQHGGYDAASGPAWPDDDLGAGYLWATEYPAAGAWPGADHPGGGPARGAMASNAVRGLPPAPGDSLPVYPPGPFAAWNRGQPERSGGDRGILESQVRPDEAADLTSQLATVAITPDEFDTNHSIPAIKDPVLAAGPRSGAAGSAGIAAGNGRGTTSALVPEPAPDASTGSRSASKGRQASKDRPASKDRTASKGRSARGDRSITKDRPASAGRSAGAGRSGARTRRKRQSAWLAIGTAGVIIAAVAIILVLTSPGGSPPAKQPKANGTPTPVATSPAPPPGKWAYIGSRQSDAVPLTMGELFPATISNAGTSYTRAKESKGMACRSALIGSALQAAVKRANCSQELRATYLSKSAKVMATIGVFNLKNVALATKAASKAGHSAFVAQLAPKAGPAHSIGQGTGIEEAIVKGHYLVLVWAEATDLSPPKGKAGRARLEAFMNLLVSHTMSSLSYRMVYGKPPPAA
jgi:hypothetical protein